MRAEPTEIRFGWVAVQKGFVTPKQVIDALVVQVKENFHTGKHRRIGEIFLEQGFMDGSQLDEVLHTLKQTGHDIRQSLSAFPFKTQANSPLKKTLLSAWENPGGFKEVTASEPYE